MRLYILSNQGTFFETEKETSGVIKIASRLVYKR